MKKIKKWSELSSPEEQISRLKNVLLIVTLAVLVLAVVVALLTIDLFTTKDDRAPAPVKTERPVDQNIS